MCQWKASPWRMESYWDPGALKHQEKIFPSGVSQSLWMYFSTSKKVKCLKNLEKKTYTESLYEEGLAGTRILLSSEIVFLWVTIPVDRIHRKAATDAQGTDFPETQKEEFELSSSVDDRRHSGLLQSRAWELSLNASGWGSWWQEWLLRQQEGLERKLVKKRKRITAEVQCLVSFWRRTGFIQW